MFKLRRIFWKVFFAFWITNLSVLIITGSIVINKLESKHSSELHLQHMRNTVSRVIEGYEEREAFLSEHGDFSDEDDQRINQRNFRSGAANGRRRAQENRPTNFPPGQRPRRLRNPVLAERARNPFIVLHEGEVILQFRLNALNRSRQVNFEFVSNSGKKYQVKTAAAPTSQPALNAIKTISILYCILVLISSALVSFILSWRITKPLNSLRTFSRQYASGDIHVSIDQKIVDRADEIGHLARDFKFMMGEIEKKSQSQKQLLHDVSHELRAPLARLQVASDILEQKLPQNDNYIDRVKSECTRLNQLIQQVLDFSRIDNASNEFVQIDLCEAIKHHVDLLKFEYGHRPFSVICADGIVVLAQEELLGRALENVLRNACKYTPDNSVIELDVHTHSNEACAVVRDHGKGIDEQDKDKLLTPFYRSGNDMHTGGFGLGLSITQRSMEKNHGRVELINYTGRGLEVRLYFKLYQPSSAVKLNTT